MPNSPGDCPKGAARRPRGLYPSAPHPSIPVRTSQAGTMRKARGLSQGRRKATAWTVPFCTASLNTRARVTGGYDAQSLGTVPRAPQGDRVDCTRLYRTPQYPCARHRRVRCAKPGDCPKGAARRPRGLYPFVPHSSIPVRASQAGTMRKAWGLSQGRRKATAWTVPFFGAFLNNCARVTGGYSPRARGLAWDSPHLFRLL